ncbi:MAG: pimeloyl-ACP methyl ester carboxylesterase [Polaribacter sp.]|jgi:pimeloyl-ACP methyl ester carboxylesterase
MNSEKVATFGSNNALTGIISEPKEIDTNKPALIILNAGLVHHAGPFRLSTKFSREIAEQGYLTLRFDLSGIGDSINHSTNADYSEQVIKDVGMAINYIKKNYAIDKVILFGICTGADNAHKVAAVNPNVVGAIFVDGYAYRTFKFLMCRYLPILMDFSRIKNLLNRIMTYHFKRTNNKTSLANAAFETRGVFTWKLPPKKQVVDELNKILNGGAELFYIFTGGSNHYCNYPSQFEKSLSKVKFGNQLKVRFDEDVDHTFILEQDQRILFREVKSWLADNFSG